MPDVGKSLFDVTTEWSEQLADANALEQRATELEQLARQIRTCALRARVRVRLARAEYVAEKMLREAGVGSKLPADLSTGVAEVGQESTCPTFDLSAPNFDLIGKYVGKYVGKSASLSPPDAFATEVGKLGAPYVHPAGCKLPADGPAGHVGGREVSRPASEDVGEWTKLPLPESFKTDVGEPDTFEALGAKIFFNSRGR